MRLSTATLHLIDARASTLSERFGGQFVPTGDEPGAAERRLACLQQRAGKDEPQALDVMINALAVAGTTAAERLTALGTVRRADSVSRPTWISDLNFIVEGVALSFTSKAGGRAPERRWRVRGRNVPYESLYWPIAEVAWEQVATGHPEASVQLGERARFGLQDSLVRRLSNILSGVLHPAFLAHKSLVASSMMQHFFRGEVSAGDLSNRHEQYASFVAEQGESGLSPLFTDFPVAARLVAEVTRLWIHFVGEFLERLRFDEKEIAQQFNGDAPLGRLIGVRAGLSDPHRGGQSVLILTFRGGLRLVYKPRPMGIDRHFYELVRTINARSHGLKLGVLSILDRDAYGWMEFARSGACANTLAARRYFQRAGALACLVYWLHGIDFHRENVVAAGEQPLLLDLECLAHPLRTEELAVDAPASSSLSDSVLRTGLLPMWQFGINGVARYDNCGFNAAITQRSLFASLRWKEVNTDRMHWINEKSSFRHSGHRAFLAGRALPMSAFARQVRAGYRSMIDILEGPDQKRYSDARDQLYGQTSRRIKRPTFVYAMILRHSLHPAYLANGIDRSIELLRLPCTRGDGDDWAQEIASLEKLDIPYFQYPATSKLSPSRALSASSGHSLAQQISTVSASAQRRVKLAAGRVLITSSVPGRSAARHPSRPRCSDS